MKNKKNKIDFHYDKDVDVLYASLGKPMPAKSVEKDNGTVLRIDPKTGRYIGFTIIDYMARLKSGMLKSVPEFEWVELPQY
jgi:hypothetical protein